MATLTIEYVQGADLPNTDLTWLDADETLIDFSSGYSFSLKVGNPGSAALLTKTTDIDGNATAPNVIIEWATSGELNTLEVGTYSAQLRATRATDQKQRYMPFELRILPAIT